MNRQQKATLIVTLIAFTYIHFGEVTHAQQNDPTLSEENNQNSQATPLGSENDTTAAPSLPPPASAAPATPATNSVPVDATAPDAETQAEVIKIRSTLQELINALIKQGALTQEKADTLLRDAEIRASTTSTPAGTGNEEGKQPKEDSAKKVVRVPYIPLFVKDEIREQIKSELRQDVVQDVLTHAQQERWGVPGVLPDWVDRIKWKGDIRLRAQGDFYGDDNAPATYFTFSEINRQGGIGLTDNPFLNTTEDRERLRARVRLGMDAKINNAVKAAFRLSTGSISDPVSTNQTLGNNANRYQVSFDQAYLQYDGHTLDGYPWISAWGGRMPNPFMSTDLVWDSDLAFEGLAATLRQNIGWGSSLYDREERNKTLFLTVGAFPLQEVELEQDKWLFGAQIGTEFKFQNQSILTFAVAYYNFDNIVGKRNTVDSQLLDYTAPGYMQKGNTLFDIRNDADPNTDFWALAADYNETNATATLDLAAFSPTHIIITADYVENRGFNREDVRSLTGVDVEEKTIGYQLQLTIGWPIISKAGDWRVTAAYKHLERDAVVDAFTDSDFHLGGTDAEGWIAGFEYGLTFNTWMSLRWLTADAIDGPPLAIDVLQIDINAKF